MRPLPHCLSLAFLAATLSAQDPWKDFRTELDQSLRSHNFFSKVKVTAIERKPFLFYVEQAADGSADHEVAVVNSYMPFLNELLAQWNKHYGKPLNLVASPKAPGYAVAILSSGGRYLDFRTAINDPSLANARAHYTPDLRLAVTYLDTFGGGGRKIDDIQPLLHEVVHALQHAHAKDFKMTAPVWFNEGLADYRSSCDTMASSLKEPPLHEDHLKAMTFGYASRAGRPYVNTLAELVEPTSYADVLGLAKKRIGQVRPELALGMFYAQSEMVVRFLHEANGGARAPQFVQYTKLVLEGASGLAAFQQAFVCPTPETMAALEQDWLKWLDAELRRRAPNLPNLVKGGGEAITGPEPMPPAIAFDTKGLAWAPEDFEERLGAARRLCGRGEFEAAQATLPDPASVQDKPLLDRLQRERERITALLQLRQRVIDDMAKSKGAVAVGDVRGKFVRRSDTGIVLLVGKEERSLPISAFTPKVLQTEGTRLKAFEGREVWLRIWLRYLQGTKLAQLKTDLAEKFSTIAALRPDMTVEFADTPGGAAEALAELQSIPTSDDPKAARAGLERLQAVVTANRSSPLLQKRREAIDLLARGLAERAFDPNDPAGLGLTGETEFKDGVVKVRYTDPIKSPTADFDVVPVDQRKWLPEGPRLPYGGQHGLTPQGKGYQVAGTALLRWAAPLRGAFRLDLVYHVPESANVDLSVMLMVSDQSALFCFLNGSVMVIDIPNFGKTDPSPVGGGGTYFVDKENTWTMEFDGKRTLVTKINGKETARVDTGDLNTGELWLNVHSGSPMPIDMIELSCTPVVREPGKMREQFVARTLAKMWP